MVQNQHIVDLIPEYVLDLLDPEDYQRVTEHLHKCVDCRNELAAYRIVIDHLALAAPEKEPPMSLKSKVLAGVNPVAKKDIPTQPSWRTKLAGIFSGSVPAWGIISLVLIMILGLANVYLWGQVNNLKSDSVVDSPMQVVAMAGTNAAPEATAVLIISSDGEYGTLVVDMLPALDKKYTYQLWLIRDGTRTSGGIFSVSDEGYGVIEIESALPLDQYPAFGVTIEPAGGSPGPTGEKVLGGEL